MPKTDQELLQAVLDARKEVNEIEVKLSEAKKVKEEAENTLIELMDNKDLKSFKSAIYNCLVLRKDILYTSIDKERKEEALQWIIEDCGRNDLVKPSIHSKTLTSFISERIKNAEQIPPELFKYFYKPTLTITMGK